MPTGSEYEGNLQILSPVVCMLGPILMFAIVGMIGTYNVAIIYVGVLFFSLFPMVNAIMTVGFVAPYRKFTFDFIRQTVKVSPTEYTFSGASGRPNAMREGQGRQIRVASLSLVSH